MFSATLPFTSRTLRPVCISVDYFNVINGIGTYISVSCHYETPVPCPSFFEVSTVLPNLQPFPKLHFPFYTSLFCLMFLLLIMRIIFMHCGHRSRLLLAERAGLDTGFGISNGG